MSQVAGTSANLAMTIASINRMADLLDYPSEPGVDVGTVAPLPAARPRARSRLSCRV